MTIVGEGPRGPTETPEDLALRTCGRCRGRFAGDPTLHAAAIAEWWACDDCRAKLGLAPDPGPSSC